MTSILMDDRDEKRIALAQRIHDAYDVDIPKFPIWNYEPCADHQEWTDDTGKLRVGEPNPSCAKRRCGVEFHRHQRTAIPWLYLIKKGLIADQVGTGKTFIAGGLMAMLDSKEELDYDRRALIVMRPTALIQWYKELHRVMPALPMMTATGQKAERVDKYLQPWQVCLIGHQMLLQDVDKYLLHFGINTLIVDDVDALRHRENRTSWALKKIAQECERVVIMTGTPLQKKLHEMHSVLEPIGGRAIFGSPTAFERRYVRTEKTTIYDHSRKKRIITQVVGYKNLEEFKRMIAPIVLRRTAADIDDVDLPTIIPSNVLLELYPKQRAKYQQLRSGVLEVIKAEGKNVKHLTAMGKLHEGARICAGLASIGEADGPDTAVKLDWIMDALEGDLEDEKAVVFVNYKSTIGALQTRLRKAGIGFETVWSDEPDKAVRAKSQERFWADPTCRLLIGTTSIEQSLNLQCARHLINVDQILNPKRMEQLAGRIRRDGSAFKHVYVHNLLCTDTQEDKYMPLLEREEALSSYVWGENSQLFEALPALALMQMITD